MAGAISLLECSNIQIVMISNICDFNIMTIPIFVHNTVSDYSSNNYSCNWPIQYMIFCNVGIMCMSQTQTTGYVRNPSIYFHVLFL